MAQSRRSTAWTAEEDQRLLDMRRRGVRWEDVRREFPEKSGNACRKRYERLMSMNNREEAIRGIEQQRLARVYMSLHERFWRTVAVNMGMDPQIWDSAERMAFELGLPQLNVLNRRERNRSRSASSDGEENADTPPDSEYSDSRMSDSPDGALPAMIQSTNLAPSQAPMVGEASSRKAHPGVAGSNYAPVSSSSMGPSAPAWYDGQQQQQQHQQFFGNTRGCHSASSTQAQPSWSPPAQRDNLRLPQPSPHNLHGSHSPEMTGVYQHQASDASLSGRLIHPTEPQYSGPPAPPTQLHPHPLAHSLSLSHAHAHAHAHQHLHSQSHLHSQPNPHLQHPVHNHHPAFSSAPQTLPSISTAIRPGSIDSMLDPSPRASPRNSPTPLPLRRQ